MEERQDAHIARADRISWALLVFGAVRMVAWLIMIVAVLLGLLHVPGFAWARDVGGLVVFVTLISFYANAATEAGNVTAAWAAIRAGRAHAQAVGTDQSVEATQTETLERVEKLGELILDQLQRMER